jgi:hypothetical protein
MVAPGKFTQSREDVAGCASRIAAAVRGSGSSVPSGRRWHRLGDRGLAQQALPFPSHPQFHKSPPPILHPPPAFSLPVPAGGVLQCAALGKLQTQPRPLEVASAPWLGRPGPSWSHNHTALGQDSGWSTGGSTLPSQSLPGSLRADIDKYKSIWEYGR